MGIIFPELDLEEFKFCLREYDFVLIGPKIGILVIEVKGSSCTQKKHFSEGNKSLPYDYNHGLEKQLKSADTLICLLQKCSRVETEKLIQVHKILCSPNLEKSRFESRQINGGAWKMSYEINPVLDSFSN